jgi:hypothetical protein
VISTLTQNGHLVADIKVKRNKIKNNTKLIKFTNLREQE